jgi:hypothetical protein
MYLVPSQFILTEYNWRSVAMKRSMLFLLVHSIAKSSTTSENLTEPSWFLNKEGVF